LEKRASEILQKEANSKKIFNKIGHALHALNPVFKENTFTENAKNAFRALDFKKPTICQSMVIFKQPFIGGEVSAHQDGTYIYNEPLKVVGLWIALEDCTLENGCLEFIPGSHLSKQ
jgi:phytanoyl-CoA hydroxylase